PIYKNTHLDIDVSNKSDRIEWGHARYQATFRPDQAYEMCIQWAVASGNIVADLVIEPLRRFPEETWLERLFLFQEAIVGRFGFIKCTAESTSHESGVGDHLYVHVTGNMFILIPTTVKYPTHMDVAPSPHEGYILTRHVSPKNKDEYDNSRRMGFLWSWNHMISKKWKWSQIPATGDETFQMRMLRDFKHFCANQEQRLSQFWDQCWELKENASGIN
ncbi:DEP domain-containing protein 5, partial [Operophtera brumata]